METIEGYPKKLISELENFLRSENDMLCISKCQNHTMFTIGYDTDFGKEPIYNCKKIGQHKISIVLEFQNIRVTPLRIAEFLRIITGIEKILNKWGYEII